MSYFHPGTGWPARPDLARESCTMDTAAMGRFQAEYLTEFLGRKP